jgi:hypothetical protein
MRRSIYWLCIVSVIVLFFIIGFASGFISLLRTDPHFQEPERYQKLVHEAKSFFYKTMYELFDGTYNPEGGYVSQSALDSFKKYRSNLEPICRLVNIYEGYGVFYGEVFFPSGDNFEVTMKKSEKGWILGGLRHLGNKQIWLDLFLYYKEKDTGYNNSKATEGK